MASTTETDGGDGRAALESSGPATIVDRASFEEFTGGERAVAGLYAYAKLDPLIELARRVSHDFFARPQLYTEIHEDSPPRLARLASRIGHHEYYPSCEEREAIYAAVFGTGGMPGGVGDFERLRDGLLGACAAFAEWSQATGIPMLRERVRTTHRPFREYLNGVTGASVAWSRGAALPALADEEAYRVLSDGAVIAVFGLTRRPDPEWPYIEDANGDKVVEQISLQLEPDPARRLTRESFSALQRIALRGAEALAAVIAFDERDDDERLDEMITRCYTWHAALGQQVPPATTNGAIPT